MHVDEDAQAADERAKDHLRPVSSGPREEETEARVFGDGDEEGAAPLYGDGLKEVIKCLQHQVNGAQGVAEAGGAGWAALLPHIVDNLPEGMRESAMHHIRHNFTNGLGGRDGVLSGLDATLKAHGCAPVWPGENLSESPAHVSAQAQPPQGGPASQGPAAQGSGGEQAPKGDKPQDDKAALRAFARQRPLTEKERDRLGLPPEELTEAQKAERAKVLARRKAAGEGEGWCMPPKAPMRRVTCRMRSPAWSPIHSAVHGSPCAAAAMVRRALGWAPRHMDLPQLNNAYPDQVRAAAAGTWMTCGPAPRG